MNMRSYAYWAGFAPNNGMVSKLLKFAAALLNVLRTKGNLYNRM
jgi:hypothetical protein